MTQDLMGNDIEGRKLDEGMNLIIRTNSSTHLNGRNMSVRKQIAQKETHTWVFLACSPHFVTMSLEQVT